MFVAVLFGYMSCRLANNLKERQQCKWQREMFFNVTTALATRDDQDSLRSIHNVLQADAITGQHTRYAPFARLRRGSSDSEMQVY